MTAREVALFLPLIAWAIWIGIYPKPYFEILRQPVAEIVERVRPGYFGGAVQNAAVPVVLPLPHGRGSDGPLATTQQAKAGGVQ
jgi:NADH-quinone oxidoreductase subunit M